MGDTGLFRDVYTFLREHQCLVGGCLVVVGSAVYYGNRYYRTCGPAPKTRVCGVDYPKDKVILHCPQTEGKFAPSDSPFVMKLEMYLRIAKIPYEVSFDLTFQDAPKGKVPWIEYNGVTMGDSQLIMNFLNKAFKVDLHKSLNPQQRAIAWAIQKWLEDSTYWLNAYIRWVILMEDYLTSTYLSAYYCQPKVRQFMKDIMTKMAHAQGVGRHGNEEVFKMMKYDLDELSDILDELKNLRDYIDRIKFQYWPDWNDRLLKE